MTDIIDRLKEACNGHPHAKIEWPHRVLHEAADEIERLRPYVDAFRREETRSDKLGAEVDDLRDQLNGVAQAPTEAREKEITRLATIEECAALCENAGNHEFTNVHRVLAARIRALALSSTPRGGAA